MKKELILANEIRERNWKADVALSQGQIDQQQSELQALAGATKTSQSTIADLERKSAQREEQIHDK